MKYRVEQESKKKNLAPYPGACALPEDDSDSAVLPNSFVPSRSVGGIGIVKRRSKYNSRQS